MRSKIVGIVGALCVSSAVMLNACNSTQSTEKSGDAGVSMGVINETCPMTGDPIDESVAAAEYNGQKIGFCCPGCPEQWAAMSDAEKQAFIDEQTAAREDDVAYMTSPPGPSMGVINATCPVRGGKVNQAVNVDYKGQKVGFCCAGCIDDWNAMSDEEKAAFINSAHEGGDANLGAVGGAKEGACDGSAPCCTETEKPAEETVNPGVIGDVKEGASGSGGCCSQQKNPVLN